MEEKVKGEDPMEVGTVDNSLVDLIVTASTSHALRGVENKVDVLIQVKTGHEAPKEGEAQRPPLNLAIVLDRSGSMEGDKLENAKASIIEVIQSLAVTDVLHLVCYGSQVVTIFDNASMSDRESLIERVKEIRTEGCTNLWGGVERGAQLLVKHQQELEKEVEFASRLFLFSDGLVNEGIQDKKEIQKKTAELYSLHRIQVSAFGLGNDFDEELMKGIAEHGNGAYFFIEGSAAIPAFVAFALKYTLEMIATEAVVKVRGVNAGLAKKFYGDHDIIQGAKLGDLRADNVRTLLMRMKVRGDVQEDEQEVLTVELLYKRKGQGDETATECSIAKSVSLHFTNDEFLVEKGKDPEVTVKVVVQQTAELDKEFVALLDGKDPDKKKKAIELQERQIELLESVLTVDKEVLGGHNKIESLLTKAKESLEKLKKKGATKEARKEAHHRQYMVRRG